MANLNETSKSFDNSGPYASNNWSFSLNELEFHLDLIKHFVSLPESADLERIHEDLLALKAFTDKALKTTYKAQESEKIIDFFSRLIENSLIWGLSLSLGEINDPNLSSILKVFCALMSSLFGLASQASIFHDSHKKTLPKKYKAWEGSSLSSSGCKISLYFINLFGKHNGFEFILKMMTSSVHLEFIYDIGVFSLIKFCNKSFKSWVDRFRRLLQNKVNLLANRKSQGIDYDKLHSICTSADSMVSAKTDDDTFELQLLSALVKNPDKNLKLKAVDEINERISKGYNLSQWIIDQRIIEYLFDSQDYQIISRSEKILCLSASKLTIEQIALIYNQLKVEEAGPCIINSLCTICSQLNVETIKFAFSLFSYRSPNEINFAASFSMAVLQRFDFPITSYRVSYFKDLLGESYKQFHSLAIETLTTLYSHFALNPMIDEEISFYIKQIKTGKNIFQTIKLILNMHKNSIRLKYLFNYKAITKVIDNLVRSLAQPEALDQNKVKTMLDFIELYIKLNKNFEEEELRRICEALVHSQYERVFSEWFDRVISCLQPDSILILFDEYFGQENKPELLTIHTYRWFAKMFLVINSYERCIELKKGCFQVRLQQSLRYLENLVEIILIGEESVFRECCQLVVSLNIRLAEGIVKYKRQIWEEFFEKIISRADGSNEERILKILHSFLRIFSTKKGAKPMFFLYKGIKDQHFNKFYIDETAKISEIKGIISEKYDRSPDQILITADGVKYDKYNEDIKVKRIKCNKLIIEFENEQFDNLRIKDFFAGSQTIQSFLLKSLESDQPYSAIAMNILDLIPKHFNNSKPLRQLQLPVNEIIPNSFYMFFYYVKIIEKLVEDLQWLYKLTLINGDASILERFCNFDSQDYAFNKSMIVIAERLLRNNKELINSKLIARILASICCVAEQISEKGKDLSIKIHSLIKFISDIGLSYLKDLSIHEIYLSFIRSGLILCKSSHISQEICVSLCEICLKDSTVLENTLSNAFHLLSATPALTFPNQSLFNLTKALLPLQDSRNYLEVLENLIEVASPDLTQGILICLQGVVKSIDTNFFKKLLETVVVGTNVCEHYPGTSEKLCELFNKVAKQRPLFEILMAQCLEVFAIDVWKGKKIQDWNLSPEFIRTDRFSYIRLKKNLGVEVLNAILYQLYHIEVFKKQILELVCLPNDTIFYLLHKVFSKLEKNYAEAVDSSGICRFLIEKVDGFKACTNNLNKFLKRFLKLISTSYSSLLNQQSLVFHFEQNYEISGQKGCSHKDKIPNYANCLNIIINCKSVKKSLIRYQKKIKLDEEITHKCRICNSMVPAIKKCLTNKFPEVMFVVIPRFEENSQSDPIKNDAYCEFPLILSLQSAKQSLKYNLTGIIAHKKSSKKPNLYSYCKFEDTWIEFTENTSQTIRNTEFFKELYGITSQTPKKSSMKNACILIYQQLDKLNLSSGNFIRKKSALETLADKALMVKIKLLISLEFLTFIEKILIENPSLSFTLRYFFLVVVRLNTREVVVRFIGHLLQQLKNNVINSETLLESIKAQDIYESALLNCPDGFKSRLIIEVVCVALTNSRPSACLRALSFFLQKLSPTFSHISEGLFEIIYLICKLNPALAAAEGACSSLFNFLQLFFPVSENHANISTPLKDRKVPVYALLSLTIFAKSLQDEQKSRFLTPEVIKIILNSPHNKFTGLHIGRLYSDFCKSPLFIKTLLPLLSTSTNLTQKPQLMILSGFLQQCKSAEYIKSSMNALKSLLKEDSCSITFHHIIDCVFLACVNNEIFLSAFREDKALLSLINNFLNSDASKLTKSNPWILEFNHSSKLEIFNTLKAKVLYNQQSSSKLPEYSDERTAESNLKLKINNSCIYCYDQKIKLFNFQTGEIF